jgi:hypothetical protein
MADASRVGYRTNGLSSALQLHHPSSRVGQTDGIALPGSHQPRKPMDHAIADSHATVTISHMAIRRHQTPQSECNAEIPPTVHHKWTEGALPGLLVLFWHEEWQEAQEPCKCGPSPLTQKPGSGPTSRAFTEVPSTYVVSWHLGRDLHHSALTRHRGVIHLSHHQVIRQSVRNDRLPRSDPGPGSGAQFADRRSLTARQRSTSRPYASPAAAPSPCRSASMPAATSAAERSPSRSPAGRACTRPP